MQLSQLQPHLRRAILLGTSLTRAELELSRDGRRLLANESIAFVDVTKEPADADPILRTLEKNGLLVIGAFLVQSPTNPLRYEKLQQTPKTAILDKIAVTVAVCQELGAKQVTISHVESGEQARGRSSSGAAQGPDTLTPYSSVEVGSSRSVSQVEIAGQSVQSSWVFAGGPPNTEAAERALEKSGFHDEELERMIQLFRSRNSPIEHQLHISTESEMTRVADMLTGVSIPYLGIQSEIKSFRKSRSVARLSMRVLFDPGRRPRPA